MRRAGPLLALLAAACAGTAPAPRAGGAAEAPRPPRPSPPPAPPQTAARFELDGAMSQGGMVLGRAPAGTVALHLDAEPVALAPDGRFLIGFGRDHGPTAELVARLVDGQTLRQTLTIRPRAWRIEALPIPRGTSPSPEFLARRSAELAQIRAARTASLTVASDGWRQRMAWPAIGRISGLFGAQRVYQGEKGAYHSGLDIARPQGSPVYAPADGVVLLAATDQVFSLEGHLLMVGHGMGLDSAFLHLSRILVRPGQRVRQGEQIGEVGMTGRATGPHLHWALTWHGERLDPLLVVPPPPAGTMPGLSVPAAP
ncbi:M23 family metallopeptidase [Sphingomonas morindae]|uniref:M23 family metallopeptidase n=1 Tax=Sphingomonas morindae TaxID=1541170 RepID=A0ABY4X9D8_9SPHN|nr:M23 family metallopeptidase [Sphingomonas morindae]USI73326.1 M23 family metallopeptidase [Sphingomonas morindae]